jgi:2,4-dienoyl-CoA reductase-like NADH-dependent reductase (Old Yellow Enzyme family)
VLAPSAIPFSDTYPEAAAMTDAQLGTLVADFAAAAARAVAAGFEVIELHGAHGYLLHQFLSPLANRRDDAYGGSFENRTRLLREVTAAVRDAVPGRLPLVVRLSATDWVEGGWDVEQTIELSRRLKGMGVSLIDVTTGGLVPNAKIPVGAGYQVEFAARVRREADIATGAVGLITEAAQADTIVRTGQADMVLLARELLRNPNWPLLAAHALRAQADWPPQYERAKPR